MKKCLSVLLTCIFLVFAACTDHNQVYDDERLIAGNDFYSAKPFSGSVNNGVYYASGNITGAITLWQYEAEEPFTLDVISTLTVASGGSALLVLISPAGETTPIVVIDGDLPAEASNNPSYTLDETGLYRIKLVATDDAAFTLSLDIPMGEFGQKEWLEASEPETVRVGL